MGYFTVWRINECNANFLRTFLGDKQRLVAWLAAFFLLFTNRLLPAEMESHDAMVQAALLGTSSFGAFLLMIGTAYLANRLFGRDVEILSTWLLMTFPGFLIYAHYGDLQPMAAALVLAAILLMIQPGKVSFMRALLFGLLCSAATFLSFAAGGILIPVVCTWLLRGVRTKTLSGQKIEHGNPVVVLIGCLIGLLPLTLPLFVKIPFYGKLGLHDWLLWFLSHNRMRDDCLDVTMLLSVCAPWLLLALPALDIFNRDLTQDRKHSGLFTLPVITAAFGLVAGACAFDLGILLPFFAVLAAWALIRGFRSAPERPICWERVILAVYDKLTMWLFPILAAAAPFWFIYCYYRPGMSFTKETIELFYIRLPLAGILTIVWAVAEAFRRKKGKAPFPFLPETTPIVNRLIPVLWISTLILIP